MMVTECEGVGFRTGTTTGTELWPQLGLNNDLVLEYKSVLVMFQSWGLA